MNTDEFADEIMESIRFVIEAHIRYPKTPDDKIRFWDKHTPYIVHPTWCAMTILTETALSQEDRINGYKALLWHDVLEDTMLELPEHTPDAVAYLVRDMTFSSFKDEISEIWSRRKEVRLLKLYDKVSNLLDGTWMNDEKWNSYVDYTIRLTDDTQLNYGNLNIVKIARTVCIKK